MHQSKKYHCPCCGFITIHEGCGVPICRICGWQADEVQEVHRTCQEGPNRVSFEEAQRNFEDFGACRKEVMEYVRPPRRTEVPSPSSFAGSWGGTAADRLPLWIREIWERRESLRTEYGDLFRRVHEILKLRDPLRLQHHESEEYVEVTETLLFALPEAQTERDARRCLRKALIQHYPGAENTPRSQYHALADAIWEVWQQNG